MRFRALVMRDNIEMEHNYLRFYSPEKDHIVMDIGGGPFGKFTHKIREKVKKVILVDPDPEEAQKLDRFSNVSVVEKGVWNRRGRKEIQYRRPTTFIFSGNPSRTKIVEIDTIDNIINDEGVEKVHFMKMDIEGAEIEALEGSSLEKIDRAVIASYHQRNGIIKDRVVKILNNKGFRTKVYEKHKPLVYGVKNEK